MRATRRSGFTLVEVVVASLIFSIAALALAVLFSSGLHLWQRVRLDLGQEETALALAEMVDRAAVARRFSPLDEKSASEEDLRFCDMVPGAGEGAWELGLVRYFVDSQGRLLREERTYAQAREEKEGRIKEMAASVEEMKVENLFFNPISLRFQTEPPLGRVSKGIEVKPDARRLTLRFRTSDGTQQKLERTF